MNNLSNFSQKEHLFILKYTTTSLLFFTDFKYIVMEFKD